MPTMVEQKKRDYELTEPEYIDHRVDAEIRNYERALEHEKHYLEQVSDKRPKEKEKLQWKIKTWENQLGRLKSGEWKRVNTSYLHEHYAKMLKKAISTGQPVPQGIIDQAPEYKAAQTSQPG
jgi:hypothetical protein